MTVNMVGVKYMIQADVVCCLQMSTSVLRALTTAVQGVPTHREGSSVAVLLDTNSAKMECLVKVRLISIYCTYIAHSQIMTPSISLQQLQQFFMINAVSIHVCICVGIEHIHEVIV